MRRNMHRRPGFRATPTLTGVASGFTGPLGASYSIADASAAYGAPASGAPASCHSATANCHRLTVSNPVVRPAAHWDASVREVVNGEAAKTWTLHVGGSFTDVPPSNGFYRVIETLFHSGVTAGCSGSSYCPSGSVTRAQMAVFLLKSKLGRSYAPPAATGTKFGDVPAGAFAAAWIESSSTA